MIHVYEINFLFVLLGQISKQSHGFFYKRMWHF